MTWMPTRSNFSLFKDADAMYWSSRRELWPRMVPERSTVSNVFGSRANKRFRYDLTLLEATERNNDRERICHVSDRVKRSSTFICQKGISIFFLGIQALVFKDAAVVQAQKFYKANEACN
ncbi:hypothetical protein LguiA_028712 [Lonicera macranthoides]